LIALAHWARGAQTSMIVESFFVGILIFCPCLFAGILPMAKQIAYLTLLKAGVMSSRVDALLDLSKVRAFCFDKTGTLHAVDSQYVPIVDDDRVAGYLSELAS